MSTKSPKQKTKNLTSPIIGLMCQFLLLVEKNWVLVDSIGRQKRKYLSFTLEYQAYVLNYAKKKAFHFSSSPRMDYALCGLTHIISTLLADGRIRTARSVLVETNLLGRAADLDILLECLGYRSQISTQGKKLLILTRNSSWRSAFLWTHRLFRTIYPLWTKNA